MRVDIDRLLKLGGTYWYAVYEDYAVEDLVFARSVIELQTAADCDIVHKCAVRDTTPLYRRVCFYPIQFNDSTCLPHGTARVPVITDRLTNPTIILIAGLDYVVKDNVLILHRKLERKVPIWWAHNIQVDERFLDDCWGSAVGLSNESTAAYRELLDLVYETLRFGVSELTLRRIIGLLYGQSVARTNETVLDVLYNADQDTVITDNDVYFGKQPVVAPGDKCRAGDSLFAGLNFDYVNGVLTCLLSSLVPAFKEINVKELLRRIIPPHMQFITTAAATE